MKKDKKKRDKKKKDYSDDKKEVCEIFKVKDNGEEKIVKVCGKEETKSSTKDQIKKENKLLKNILIGLGIFTLFFASIFLFVNLSKGFEYKEVSFDIVKEKKLIFYKTSLDVIYKGKIVPYNFYLRNDPRNLEDINFEGNIVLLENMVINMTEKFNCDGDGIISVANFVQLYGALGTKVIKDESANCDEDGRYMFVQIQPGEITNIKQIGPACYEINVNNCEILKATEKFMIETFVKVNK